MWFLDNIISWLNSIKEWHYSAYEEVSGWVWPFHHLATPLWYIYLAFYYLTIYFGNFNEWVDDAVSKLASILNFGDIYSYFKTFFDDVATLWNWWVDRVTNIWNIIDDWWLGIRTTVLGWIDGASQFARSLVDQVNTLLGNLQAAWDSFISSILPSLACLTDIDDLIISRLKEWFPWYDTLTEIWSEIVAFFVNPFDYLLDKFADWFLGKE